MNRSLNVSFFFVSLVLVCAPVRAHGSSTYDNVNIERFIRSINPHVSQKRAQRLSSLLLNVSQKYGLDPLLFSAIIAQESRFKRNLESKNEKRLSDDTKVTYDYGIAQINWETWGDVLSLDRDKLRYDDEYNINIAAFVLLRVKRSYSLKEPYIWWSRYHSNIEKNRRRYEKDVMKFLPKNRLLCVDHYSIVENQCR